MVNCNSNGSSKSQASCDCDASWFDDNAANPADSTDSEFNKLRDNTNNCMFHKFSVQKFLWVTRNMAKGKPYFLDSLIQVNINLDSSYYGLKNRKYGTRVVLDDSLQA
ncbi:MAG: hypothetical protein ACKO2Z_03570, partial [Sphaerospermopsis kisseleviana]